MADFATFFEVIFDPAVNPEYWLVRRTVNSTVTVELSCLHYLREIIASLYTGVGSKRIASSLDIETLCQDEYDFAAKNNYFAVLSLATGTQLRWIPSIGPGNYATNRAWTIAAFWNTTPSTPPPPMQGSLPLIDMPEEETDEISGFEPNCKPESATIEALEKLKQDMRSMVAGNEMANPVPCYLCARRGLFVGSPKICGTCRAVHLDQTGNISLGMAC